MTGKQTSKILAPIDLGIELQEDIKALLDAGGYAEVTSRLWNDEKYKECIKLENILRERLDIENAEMVKKTIEIDIMSKKTLETLTVSSQRADSQASSFLKNINLPSFYDAFKIALCPLVAGAGASAGLFVASRFTQIPLFSNLVATHPACSTALTIVLLCIAIMPPIVAGGFAAMNAIDPKTDNEAHFR